MRSRQVVPLAPRRAPETHPDGWCLTCRMNSHARPLRKNEGGLKLPNLRHDRWRHGRHIGLLPHLAAGLRLHGYPRSKGLKDLHAPQSRGPRDQHATDAEARPQIQAQPMGGKLHGLLYPDARLTQLQTASLIKHRHPATAMGTHSRSRLSLFLFCPPALARMKSK